MESLTNHAAPNATCPNAQIVKSRSYLVNAFAAALLGFRIITFRNFQNRVIPTITWKNIRSGKKKCFYNFNTTITDL